MQKTPKSAKNMHFWKSKWVFRWSPPIFLFLLWMYFFIGNTKMVSQLRSLMKGGGLGLKNQCKTAFLGVKSFCQIALIMFRVFNGKIRGNCNLYSLRLIIFWHSTPIMRKMCLKKLKKGCNWPFFGFFFKFWGQKTILIIIFVTNMCRFYVWALDEAFWGDQEQYT